MVTALLLMLLMAQAAAPVQDAGRVAEAREGVVELECMIRRDGRVTGCIVLSETPRGHGFGQAAVSAARRARLSPRSLDGVATGDTVRFKTRFPMQDPPAA